MPQKIWFTTPSSKSLESAKGWRLSGAKTYSAVRQHILVVEDEREVLDGPELAVVKWPENTKLGAFHKVSNMSVSTETIQKTVTSTVTEKLTGELGAKIGGIADLTKFSVNGELTAKRVRELTSAVQEALSTTTTYSTQRVEEVAKSIEASVPPAGGKTRRTFLHLIYRKMIWDVYLVHSDYLSVDYERVFFLKFKRKMGEGDREVLNRPLFRLTFYVPFEFISYDFDSYSPQVRDVHRVRVEALNGSPPKGGGSPPPLDSLESLARLAFPIDKGEQLAKKIAAQKVVASKKAPAKKAPAKKAAAKKAPAKKAPAKKAAAKKAPAKKAPAKKAAARRAAA